MSRPLVIGYHLIWTAYGTWLPNDPRGSGSRFVVNDVLNELGELHYGRKKVQPESREIQVFYEKAAPLLKYPVFAFGPEEIQAISQSFETCITENKYTCYACAIMPDHVHILIRKHRDQAEDMMGNLRNSSLLALTERGFGGMGHPVWTGGLGWKVFLDHPDEIRRTIRYIQNNPIKGGLGPQVWEFVKEYDGWPLHPGHNPNSPWARRLRGEC